jgi:hypothetical protein
MCSFETISDRSPPPICTIGRMDAVEPKFSIVTWQRPKNQKIETIREKTRFSPLAKIGIIDFRRVIVSSSEN